MTNLSLFDFSEVSTKICAKCQQEKPLVEFGNQAQKKDGKNIYCKPCMQEFRKAWYENNKEKAADASKKWRCNHKERVKEGQRNLHHANPERAAAKRRRAYCANREKRLESAKRVKLENRDFYTQLQRLREAKRSQAFPLWANRKKMNAIYREARRLEQEDGIKRHVDHIVPLVHPLVSGLHCEFNLQILTATENVMKHNKFEIEP